MIGQYRALDQALVGHQVDRLGRYAGAGGQRGNFLLNDQTQGAAFVDMRGHLQGDADILALDSGEGVVGTCRVGGVRAGLERYVLPDEDFRGLVVQGQQAGGGQQVAVAVGRQRGDQCAEVVATDANDGAIRQVDRLLALQCAEQGAYRQAAVAEVATAQCAVPGAIGDGPLHAERLADVARHLDDGCLDQHLGTWHIELAHDAFQLRDDVRLGHQDQRIEALVGADHQRCTATAVSSLLAQGFGQLAEGFRQLLGIAMAQADNPRVGRLQRCYIKLLGELEQALTRFRRAEQQQAIAAGVGNHLQAAGFTAWLALQAFQQHPGDVLGPGMAQVIEAAVIAAGAVDLIDQRQQALDVGAAVADDQRIARGNRRQVALLRYQRANQRQQFADRRVLHLQQAGLQAVCVLLGRTGLGARLAVGDDACLAILIDHGIAMGAEHREKQLVDLAEAQRGL